LKKAVTVQVAGAGEEDGEEDAPPAVDYFAEESTSEDDLEVGDTSGPAPMSGTTTSEPAPASTEMAVESPDPAGEKPPVDVSAAAEPATRKHKNEQNKLGVDGVDEESSPGAAPGYTIPKRAKTAEKPSDSDSAARTGHREREWRSRPDEFEDGIPLETSEALGIVTVKVPKEGRTVVVSGLDIHSVPQLIAAKRFITILHEANVIDGLVASKSIATIETRGNGDLFITFKDDAVCTLLLNIAGPVLLHNIDQIQHQLRPIAARGANVLARAWVSRSRFREMSAYAQGGRGRGRFGGHSQARHYGGRGRG